MEKKLLFILVLLVFAACNKDKAGAGSENAKPADTIDFAQFYVRFLETENQIKANVSFYTGDSLETARPLELPGTVQFQNNSMTINTLERVKRYVYNSTSEYAATGFTFSYKDFSGNAQQHQIQLAPIQDFTIQTADKNELILKITGAPFDTLETLVILLTNAKNQTFSAELQVPPSNEIALPQELREQVSPNNNALYLVKKKTVESTQGKTQVTSSIEYYTKSIQF